MGNGMPRWSSAVPGLAAFAAVTLAMALAISGWVFSPLALALVTVAGAAALAGAFGATRHVPGSGARPAIWTLAVGLAISWVADLLYRPGALVDPSRLGAFRPLLGAVGLVLLGYLWRSAPSWARWTRFVAVVSLGAALAATVIVASPHPGIDVWELQQGGAAALLSGRNPYALHYWNRYGPGTPFLDPSVLTPDGRYISAFPYMPLVLLLDVPGVMVGDVRWTMLAALVASAFLLRSLGRGSIAAELAGALLLLQPRGFVVLEFAWTEPLALAGMLLVALALTNTDAEPGSAPSPGWKVWVLPGLAAAVALSTKQYVPLLLVPFLVLVRPGARLRAAALAAAGTAMLLLPLLVLDPRAFARGVVEFHVAQPFRADSLSWPAAIHALGGLKLPSWPAFLLAGGVLASMLRGRMTAGRAMLTAAAAWLVFVAFNKQAFANYYWMGVGLLCAAVALLTAPEPHPEIGSTQWQPKQVDFHFGTTSTLPSLCVPPERTSSPLTFVTPGWQREHSALAPPPPCVGLCQAPAAGDGGLPWQARQAPRRASLQGGVTTGPP